MKVGDWEDNILISMWRLECKALCKTAVPISSGTSRSFVLCVTHVMINDFSVSLLDLLLSICYSNLLWWLTEDMSSWLQLESLGFSFWSALASPKIKFSCDFPRGTDCLSFTFCSLCLKIPICSIKVLLHFCSVVNEVVGTKSLNSPWIKPLKHQNSFWSSFVGVFMHVWV